MFFVLLLLIVCIMASIVLERGSRFDLGNGDITYFTISTFYNTFNHKNPVCVEEDSSQKIRASLSMAYLALFVLVLCSQISYRSFRYELRLREKTRQQEAINIGPSKSRREVQQGIEADETRGARSLIPNREIDGDDDIEQITL